MYHPVKMPIPTVMIILVMLTALEIALIFSLCSERTRSLLPINAGTNSFGDMIAVARPYMSGWTVGNVETAPLHIEYGKGHNRIIHRSLRPSYLRVKARAANRLSFSIKRLTNLERIVRDTINEHVEPIIVALA